MSANQSSNGDGHSTTNGIQSEYAEQKGDSCPDRTEQDRARFDHTSQNSSQFKILGVLNSGTFHLLVIFQTSVSFG